MGIFKKLLRKEIYLENKYRNELVYPLTSKKLKIGSTLKVPEGFAFVLGYDGKVLDCFEEGEKKLDLTNMPETVKRFKLNKPDKNGKFIKKVKVNGYYVNLNEFIFPWQTYRRMVFKDNELGYFKAKSNGEIILKVENAKLFMKALLTEYSYLKKGEGKKITLSFISEFLTLFIEKKNYDIVKLVNISPEITEEVKNGLTKKFEKYGISTLNLYIREFKLPKKLQENISSNTYTLEELEDIQEDITNEENQNVQKSVFTDYGIVVDEKIDKDNNVTSEIEENPLISTFYDYKDESFYEDYKDNNFETTPYEITNPFQSEEQEVMNQQEVEKEKAEEISVWGNYENWDNHKKSKSTPKFVDLSLETLYDEKKEK